MAVSERLTNHSSPNVKLGEKILRIIVPVSVGYTVIRFMTEFFHSSAPGAFLIGAAISLSLLIISYRFLLHGHLWAFAMAAFVNAMTAFSSWFGFKEILGHGVLAYVILGQAVVSTSSFIGLLFGIEFVKFKRLERLSGRKGSPEDERQKWMDVKVTPAMIQYALQELQKEVPQLVVQLKDTDPHRRATAAEILGNAGVALKDVIHGLTDALHDSDGVVQVHAAVSLDILMPQWTDGMQHQALAPKLAAAVIDNKTRLDHKKRIAAAKIIQKLDPARGQALLALTQFESDVNGALAAKLGVSEKELQQVDMKDKLPFSLSASSSAETAETNKLETGNEERPSGEI